MFEQLEEFLAARAGAKPRANGYEEKVREWIEANSEQRAFTAVKLADNTLELNMLDVIGRDYWTGGGITAKTVKATLDQNKDAKTIKVLMNSPGGDAFEGLAIQNLLKRTGARIEFEIIGLAASAATVIAMAGDTIAIHEGAMFMIHEAWTFEVGNKRDLRETAAFLEKVDGSILDIYARRTGRTADEITPLVEATTWMTAHEAVTEKFATSVIQAKSGNNTDKKAKAGMAEQQPQEGNGAPAALPPSTVNASIVPDTVNGDELTEEERDLATKAAADAAARAVSDKREEERRIFMATNPLARAGKPPAPPFGGLRNK